MNIYKEEVYLLFIAWENFIENFVVIIKFYELRHILDI